MDNQNPPEHRTTSFRAGKDDYPVFKDERQFIEKRRENMSCSTGTMVPYPTTENNLVGLCLSGGGIRSATFNLGFMQALYRYKVLRRVDYLSTVSGGGYIGSCLTSLLNTETGKMENKEAVPPQEDGTAPKADHLWDKANFPFSKPADNSNNFSGMAERAPVRHLRYFSNYLTAEGNPLQKYLGPVLAVTRGLLFNLLLIAPFIILAAALLAAVYHIPEGRIGSLQLNSTVSGMQRALDAQKKAVEAYKSDAYKLTQHHDELDMDERIQLVHQNPEWHAALRPLQEKVDAAAESVRAQWWAMLAIPLLALGLMMIMAFFLLVAPKKSSLALRFNFSYRFSQILFVSLGLLAIQAFGAALVYWEHYDIPDKLAFVSLLTFLGPRLLKDHAPTNGGTPKKAIVRILLSVVLMALTPVVLLYFTGVCVNFLLGNYMLQEEPFNWIIFAASLMVGTGLLIFTNRWLNVNKISLHNFYRDRLCRAFIIQGDDKTNSADRPFESVTPKDDGVALSGLYEDSDRHTGPYHILNANLNLKKRMPERPDGKKNTVLDQGNFRKGESFIFSKHWCGSAKTEFISTDAYQELDPHLDLGTAMAISGAAANIGMGQGDLPLLRMLMGLLNIRLGYWAPNPRRVRSWKNRLLFGRVPGAFSAISEWFGQYSLNGKFINLSDGGHFDNIGVYELLRRRCKYIIVADAEADQTMKFQALSYLIRLARIDFNIHIDIDISNLKLDDTTKLSGQHCVMGTIHYPKNESNNNASETGYIFYCKSSLTGDEPAHLNEYRVKNPSFPHQTTADQWFDEQQFEAYRELGYHIGKESVIAVEQIKDNTAMEDFFIRLKEFWYPRSRFIEERFTQHASELNRIIGEVKEDPNLAFMDAQMYPEWEKLMASTQNPPRVDMWLPRKAAERRAGFYICKQMIQLMENVYIDLNLEEEYQHPDNRGWINLFMHWAWAGMFRVTWAITACTYGAKFQRFCERRLNLGESQVISVVNLGRAVGNGDEPGKPTALELPAALSDDELAKVATSYLNEYEITKVDEHLKRDNGAEKASPTKTEVQRSCYGFILHVQNPLKQNDSIDFCFGFALTVQEVDAIHIDYFRIQDHLRQMGLGRQAMEELLKMIVVEQSNAARQDGKYDLGYERATLESFELATWAADLPKLAVEVRKLRNLLDSVVTEIADSVVIQPTDSSET